MMLPRSGGTLRAPSMVGAPSCQRVVRGEGEGPPGNGEGRGSGSNVTVLAINGGASWRNKEASS